MSETRLVVAFCLAVAVATVAAGPLVGAVDPGRTGTPPPGTGSADVRVVSVPTDRFAFVRERFGAGKYRLDAPPAVVAVEAVEGNPTVTYAVDVPALSWTATGRYDLAGAEGNRLRLRPAPRTVAPDRLERDRYAATVAVWVRTGDAYTAVFQ